MILFHLLFIEIRQIKGRKYIISNSNDGNYDNNDIVNVFLNKYMSLYNSVP